MPKHLLIIILLVAILLAILFFVVKKEVPKSNVVNSSSDNLQLISIIPNPLDNATILPTQNLEFTFNQPLFKSEFKYKFDPTIEHEVEVVSGRDTQFGSTFRIKFKKPLPLGSGFTLMIEAGTKVDEQHKLDRDYIYHFQTIRYQGV